ncbi:MAG: MAPEG family protein [Pseudomonadales bacterium]|nr:MAPEG family protein [Pseudomonadales bacterium]
MSNHAIFFPIIVHILLVIALYIVLSTRKNQAVASGNVDESRRGLFDDAWPESVIKVNNCIRNQFEIPILFYMIAFMLWALNAVDAITLILSWAFVVSRVVHAFIHTGTNTVPIRRKIFTLGVLILLAMSILATRALFSIP